jgi:hypothetical protein
MVEAKRLAEQLLVAMRDLTNAIRTLTMEIARDKTRSGGE